MPVVKITLLLLIRDQIKKKKNYNKTELTHHENCIINNSVNPESKAAIGQTSGFI